MHLGYHEAANAPNAPDPHSGPLRGGGELVIGVMIAGNSLDR
jgi:hypothetical protein